MDIHQGEAVGQSVQTRHATSVRQRNSQSKKPTRNPRQHVTKQAQVLELLSRKEGAAIAAIMKATGWQQHSVRGFFAGIVRKKLGLKLVSDDANGTRVYRIVSGGRAKKTFSSQRAG